MGAQTTRVRAPLRSLLNRIRKLHHPIPGRDLITPIFKTCVDENCSPRTPHFNVGRSFLECSGRDLKTPILVNPCSRQSLQHNFEEGGAGEFTSRIFCEIGVIKSRPGTLRRLSLRGRELGHRHLSDLSYVQITKRCLTMEQLYPFMCRFS